MKNQQNNPKEVVEEIREKTEEKVESDKQQPLKGNGGQTDRYVWSQPLIEEVNINIPIAGHFKGRDLNITSDSKKLKVQVKGGETIIDGEYPHPINVYMINAGRFICLGLG